MVIGPALARVAKHGFQDKFVVLADFEPLPHLPVLRGITILQRQIPRERALDAVVRAADAQENAIVDIHNTKLGRTVVAATKVQLIAAVAVETITAIVVLAAESGAFE